MSQNETICQKIASWFAPQTKPQPRFYVPTPEPKKVFDWIPVLEKAKLEISQLEDENLAKLVEEHEKAVADYFIEISSYRNNTIKIIRNGQIDVIPIEDIRRVSLKNGKAPEKTEARFHVDRTGNFRCYTNYFGLGLHSRFDDEGEVALYAPKAYEAVDDKVEVSPVVTIVCPFGLGDSILNKIQELMAE